MVHGGCVVCGMNVITPYDEQLLILGGVPTILCEFCEEDVQHVCAYFGGVNCVVLNKAKDVWFAHYGLATEEKPTLPEDLPADDLAGLLFIYAQMMNLPVPQMMARPNAPGGAS